VKIQQEMDDEREMRGGHPTRDEWWTFT